ncbi:MAG: hypothetical protein ABL958_07760 [Bdellovibrionia bacterium]
MTRLQIVSFSILHVAATLSIPLLIFLLGGCLEPELQNKPGPAIPCPEIEKALNDSLTGPWTFAVGEFAHIQDTAAPVNQPPTILRDTADLVLQIAPQTGYTGLRIEHTVVKQGVTDTSEVIDYAPSTFVMCSATSTDTFHNLTVTKTKMAVPHASQDPCDPRFPNCEMDVTHFKFDKLVEQETGERLPLHVLITTSNQVPYLSRVVQFCVTEPLETNGPRIPVTQCSTVRNFRFKAP